MIKSAKVTWKTAIIPIATVFLIWWCKISPAYVILAAIAGSIIYALIIRHKTRDAGVNPPDPLSRGSGPASRVSKSQSQKEKEAKP
jgi:hypothetical protein